MIYYFERNFYDQHKQTIEILKVKDFEDRYLHGERYQDYKDREGNDVDGIEYDNKDGAIDHLFDLLHFGIINRKIFLVFFDIIKRSKPTYRSSDI